MNGRPVILRRRQAGLSYVEALLAAVVLAIGLVPALDSLQSAFTTAAANDELLVQQHRIASRMEEVAAEPYWNLYEAATDAGSESVPSSYSDPVGPDRILVFLSLYDGDVDPFTVTDEGLIWIRVVLEGSSQELTTLRAL